MVYLNENHINAKVPKGVYGGAKCICNDCKITRLKEELKELYEKWDGKCLVLEQEIQEIEGELEELGVDVDG